MINEKQREEILQAIDRGSWKHSWHLNKNRYGYLDFADPANLNKIISVLEQERSEGIQIAARADNLLTLVGHELAEIEEDLAMSVIEDILDDTPADPSQEKG